jgi:hypothetical protein
MVHECDDLEPGQHGDVTHRVNYQVPFPSVAYQSEQMGALCFGKHPGAPHYDGVGMGPHGPVPSATATDSDDMSWQAG